MNNNNDDEGFVLALHHSLNPCHLWPHKTNCRRIETEMKREMYLLMWLVLFSLGRRMYPCSASFLEALAFWKIMRKDFYDIHANKVSWIDVELNWGRETRKEKTDVQGGGVAGCRKEKEELTWRETERGRRSSRWGVLCGRKDDGGRRQEGNDGEWCMRRDKQPWRRLHRKCRGSKRTDRGLWRGLIDTWDGNLEITAWDVHLDRKLIDGRSHRERKKRESPGTHTHTESDKKERVDAQQC